jgi:hypothetical protein
LTEEYVLLHISVVLSGSEFLFGLLFTECEFPFQIHINFTAKSGDLNPSSWAKFKKSVPDNTQRFISDVVSNFPQIFRMPVERCGHAALQNKQEQRDI